MMTRQEIIAKANEAASRFGLTPSLFVGLLQHESANFKPAVLEHKQRSSTGAYGVGQFMPATGKDFGLTAGKPDIAREIDAAAQYMSQLKRKYGGDETAALNAYNWGPGNVDKFRAGKIKNMPAETIGHQAAIEKIAGTTGTGTSGQQGYSPKFEPTTPSFVDKLRSMAPVTAQALPEQPAIAAASVLQPLQLGGVPLSAEMLAAQQPAPTDESWRSRVMEQAMVSDSDRARRDIINNMLSDHNSAAPTSFARLPQGVESALERIVSEA
jgi:Transglycosylase SLT domain